MVGPPKNRAHLFDPLLLQHPVFSGLILGQPFMDYGLAQDQNIVRVNGTTTPAGAFSWSRNEYGPCGAVGPDEGLVTTLFSDDFDYQSFTFIIWAATTSTGTGRELFFGTYLSSAEYIRAGRSSNNYYWYIKSGDGIRTTSEATVGHNDGQTHCFGLSSSPLSMDLYFNGDWQRQIFQGAYPVSHFGSSDTDPIEIGSNDTADTWLGTMSLALLWNRGLSPLEMKLVYDMGPSLTLPSGMDEIYRAAISEGAPAFNAAWAYNSNQVL